uniref:GM2 ganglioside activator n=1 Tax=Sinocyclocheilus anshuiensis TaxID=1608454 RepID=A0A671KXH9_9TELE
TKYMLIAIRLCLMLKTPTFDFDYTNRETNEEHCFKNLIPCTPCYLFQVNVTLEREIAGVWLKIPCLDEIGSCHYPNVCDLLDQLIPPGQDCPEPLHTYGLPCHCPFKAVNIVIPDVELPGWLTNGNYKVQGILGNSEKEMGCLKISFSLHSLKN